MPLWKLAPVALLALAAARPAAANCGRCEGDHAGHAAVTKNASAQDATGKVDKGVRTIEIAVTKEGFTPAEVKAKAGETVKLAVTRQVERTCATEIVMKDFGVNQPLPLGKTVIVTVKPTKPGTYRYACGMDMIAGALVVQ